MLFSLPVIASVPKTREGTRTVTVTVTLAAFAAFMAPDSESQAALLRLGRSGGPNDQAEHDIRVPSPLDY